MKAEVIRQKLKKYYRERGDAIILEIIEGTPEKGGVWVEVEVSKLEEITENIKKLPADQKAKAWLDSGYDKYVKKWISEGLITEADL
jgi:hypothetical protein